MNEVILLKYGEIILKGQNRYRFEEVMIRNIKNSIREFGKASVTWAQSTVYVSFEDEDVDILKAEDALKKVFGLSSVVRARKVSYDFEEVKQISKEYLGSLLESASTFKVMAKRADKRYPMKSPEIGMLLGEYLLDNFANLSVDLHKPQVTVYAEVREGSIYVHADPEKGAGGLPVGVSGHGLLMLSGGIDSPVAGYHMTKRGMRLSAIHFESPPYTSDRAKMKVIKLAKKLSAYAISIDLYTVHFTEIQELIRKHCREDLFTVIMRRFMLRIACKVSEKCGAKAIITGESLGQVASQTLDAITCTDEVSTFPVFRPLIGSDKQEIINVAYKIDTFETSIEPYEDCCTVFTPKHPKTSPKLEDVKREEEKLNIEELINAVEIEKLKITKGDRIYNG